MRAKNVTVVDGGVSVVVKTKSGSVEELLRELEIAVGPYDRLSQPATAAITEGSRIEIDRAVGITVQVDGKSELRFTTEDTVGGALQQLDIALEPDDRVTPAADAALTSGMEVKVVRVDKEIVETKHPLTFAVVEKKDNTLTKGKQKVVQAGQNGLIVKRMERIYEDGLLVSERLIDKQVARPAVEQVVAVGTRKEAEVSTASLDATVLKDASGEVKTLQLGGQSVKVKSVLKNVTLTAYSAGPASTGKKKGDKGYGITYSGTKVQEGRTIAVDTKVIPMGWWVYIEGIGFRRAEDKGSAVKGKKIDIYFDSESYAQKLGTKRGYTVYLIGPTKPSAI